MRTALLAPTTATVLCVALVACAPPSASGTDLERRDDRASTDPLDDWPEEDWPEDGSDGAPSDTSAPTSADAGGGACAGEATALACSECCEKAHPDGRRTFNRKEDACLCEAPGKCAEACAQTYCAGRVTEPRSPCADCIAANGPACEAAASAACEPDAECNAMLACKTASGCASKPK